MLGMSAGNVDSLPSRIGMSWQIRRENLTADWNENVKRCYLGLVFNENVFGHS